MNNAHWKSPLFALALAATVGCGTPSDDPDNDPAEEPTVENASDYPELGVSEACGGKCDNPDAALLASKTRLIAELVMTDYETADGEFESFRLGSTELVELEEGEDAPEVGHTLALEIWANDGASNEDFKVEAELVYDGEIYTTDVIDTSDLLPWQLLRVDVKGELGDREILQGFEFAPGFEIGDEVIVGDVEDPFAQAYDVTLPVIYIDPAVPAPDYQSAQDITDGFGLGGTEFWQRWEGGHSPTFSYSAGTELGRKCMYASARRFEAIMQDAPESMRELRENTNWSGRFFNWNDDFSDESAYRRPRGAVLWAWRTGLIKWISQTGPDGSCFLPTLEQVERAAANCSSTGESNDGEIEGCQAG